VGGTDQIWERASDGLKWSAWHALTVTAVQPSGPPAPQFDLAPADQSGAPGSHQTQAATVTLVGHTGANDTVVLISGGSTLATTTSSNSGAFQFANVNLALGDNPFTAQATDSFGQTSKFSLDIDRLAQSGSANAALVWNQLALAAIKKDASTPEFASRALGMESLAVFDVVSAIDGTPGYLVNMSAPSDADVNAAVAQAAHDVLAYLFPDQKASFDAQLGSTLAAIANGQGKTDGIAFGQAVAAKIIALRANDGWNVNILDEGSTAVGQWQPTAPSYLTAQNPQWANLTPFALTSPDQFTPSGPPALTSQAYADAVNKTQSLGAANSTTRTADETQIANFWKDGSGTHTPPGQWNDIADQIAQQQGSSLAATARLLAELDVAEADAAITAWNTKYTYNTWRPDTAIQNANEIGNPGITADPNWQPLIIDPPFPEYISGHSTFSAAAADILSSFFGASFAFSYTDSSLGSLPGVTRSFTSFEQAAQEAGESRIYGGIHFEFSNQDGQTAGQNVGDWVLQAFNITEDTLPPQIVLNQSSGLVTNKDPTITGDVVDNLSGVASLTAALDGAAAKQVSFNGDGTFTLPIALPLGGAADGQHSLSFVATDAAGNATAPLNFTFTLDTKAPVITLAASSIKDGGTLTTASHLTGTADPSGSTLATLSYAFDGGTAIPMSRDAASGAFDQTLDLSKLSTGSHTLTLTAADAAGNTATDTLHVSLPSLIPLTVTNVMPVMGAQDVGVTYRPEIMFSRPIDISTLTSASFYATDSTGAVLPATIVPTADATAAWLFFNNPMPGGSTITLHVQGEKIKGKDGTLLDAAENGTPGSDLSESFTTVSTAAVPGTTITGKVVDTGPDGTPMTPDDVKAAADGLADYANDTWKLPIASVKVFVLGHEDQAVYTDASGNFTLTAVPTGDVKVVINGNTATNAPSGFYFPEMVMDTTVRAGIANTIMGSMGEQRAQDASAGNPAVYLPRVATSVLTPISNNASTDVTLQPGSALGLTSDQAKLVSLDVLPGSLIGADGNLMTNGSVGISMVSPALIQDMLPTGMKVQATMTIQAPGVAKFATPLPLTMPNIYGAAPGTQLFFYSYDHTTGQASIEGTATVSGDGTTVTTDPGTGITAPGWHFISPAGAFGSGGGGGPPGCGGPPPSLEPPPDTPEDTEEDNDPIVEPVIYGDGTDDGTGEFKLSWTAPDKLPDTPPPPPPPGGPCPPPRPQDPPKEHQPYITVTIDVDGPLEKYMEQKGDLELTSQSFTLQAGSGETRRSTWSPRATMTCFPTGWGR
jgi:PAP2 superfamily/Bacterial Ig-like domain